MTGAGTAADPYIVTTWEEFLDVATEASVYIKCADNCVWDFNDIAPEGISNVNLSFADWDGNGVQLRNIAHYNTGNNQGYGFKFNSNNIFTMKNVNFINCYCNSDYRTYLNALFRIAGEVHASNCTISAMMTRGILFSGEVAGSIFSRCSLTIKAYNDSDFIANTNSISFSNCKFSFDGDSTGLISGVGSTAARPVFENCKIIGNLPYKSLSFNSNTTVIDAGIKSTADTIVGTHTTTLLNSDKIASGAIIKNDFKQVTETQMVDISYLQSIGFPVIEV